MKKNKSKLTPSTLAARVDGLKSASLAWCAGALILLSGCTVIPRLDVPFDTDPTGVPSSTPTPTPPGDSNVLQGFRGERLNDPFAFPSIGQISAYRPGNVIDINWTLDQASRTFSASVLGGASQSSSFPAVSGALATTPIQRLQINLWMQKPTTDTVLFIDNLRAEEYR